MATKGKSFLKHLWAYGAGVATHAGVASDASCVATAGGTGVFVWEPKTGELLRALRIGPVAALAFAPLSRRLAVAPVRTRTNVRGYGIYLFDLDNVDDSPSATLVSERSEEVRSIAFSADEAILIATHCYLQTIVVCWDVASRVPMAAPARPNNESSKAAVSPDGKLLALAGTWKSKSARLFRLPSCEPLESATLPAADSVGFVDEGARVWGCSNKEVWAWDVRRGEALEPLAVAGDDEKFTAAAIEDSGKVFAVSGKGERGSIRWHRRDEKCTVDAPYGSALSLSSDASLVAMNSLYDAYIYNWNDGKPSRVALALHVPAPRRFAFVDDEDTLIVEHHDFGAHTAFTRWSVRDGSLRERFVTRDAVMVSASGRRFTLRREADGIVLLDPSSESARARVDAPSCEPESQTPIWPNALDDGAKIAFARDDDELVVLAESATAFQRPGKFSALAFDAAGKVLAAMGPYELHLFEAASGKELACTRDICGGDSRCHVAVHGDRVAATNGVKIVIWKVSIGSVSPLKSKGTVWSLAFSRDGRWLAVGDDEGATLWDMSSRKAVMHKELPQVCALGFSPSGKLLATGTVGGAIDVWSMTPALPRTRVA